MKLIFNQKGNAVVEVAVMLPLIIMLIAGPIMLNQGSRQQIVLDTAAREGAREYAKTHSAAQAVDKIEDELKLGGINPDDVEIKTISDGYERQVRIRMQYPFMIPFAGKQKPTLQGFASFHVESTPQHW